jgi:LmbE family N-acetylglucosaminyl deacetylase
VSAAPPITTGGILLLLAHPDDESFFAAGTAVVYAARGIRTALVCATRGQAGSAGRPPITTREALPHVREEELRRACEITGIVLLEILDYQDKHLAEAPHDQIREQLARAIRRERPRIVATFDPNGVNGHTDHIAISRFASDAVAAAADPRWMPEAGPPHRIERLLWTPLPLPWEEWRPERLAEHPGVDFIVDVRAARERKAQALHAHRTQHQSIERCWFAPPASEEILAVECFRQGWGPPLARRPEHDLFAGLGESPRTK